MRVLDFPSAHIDDKAASQLPAVVLAQMHGDDDPDRLAAIAAQDLAHRDFLHALSVMCWPDNPDEWVRLNHALTAHELYESTKIISGLGIDGSVPADVMLDIADRKDPTEILNSMLSNGWLAHIAAGYVLRWIVSRWQSEQTKADASLAKAAKAIEEWCSRYGIYGAKEQHIKKNIWPKYGCVSHLWAAWFIMRDAEVVPSTPLGFLLFCGTAQWLLDQAINIVPKGRRPGETILARDQAWSIPDSHVRRMPDGSVDTRLWIDNPDAHDIRCSGAPPFRQQV